MNKPTSHQPVPKTRPEASKFFKCLASHCAMSGESCARRWAHANHRADASALPTRRGVADAGCIGCPAGEARHQLIVKGKGGASAAEREALLEAEKERARLIEKVKAESTPPASAEERSKRNSDLGGLARRENFTGAEWWVGDDDDDLIDEDPGVEGIDLEDDDDEDSDEDDLEDNDADDEDGETGGVGSSVSADDPVYDGPHPCPDCGAYILHADDCPSHGYGRDDPDDVPSEAELDARRAVETVNPGAADLHAALSQLFEHVDAAEQLADGARVTDLTLVEMVEAITRAVLTEEAARDEADRQQAEASKRLRVQIAEALLMEVNGEAPLVGALIDRIGEIMCSRADDAGGAVKAQRLDAAIDTLERLLDGVEVLPEMRDERPDGETYRDSLQDYGARLARLARELVLKGVKAEAPVTTDQRAHGVTAMLAEAEAEIARLAGRVHLLEMKLKRGGA